MGQVLIRNLDDDVIAEYKRAAADHGRSLEAELREALRSASPRRQRDRDDLVALSQRLRESSISPPGAKEGWILVREDRDGYRSE